MKGTENLAFTYYVRSLDGEEEPDRASIEAVWTKTSRLLESKLKARSLWSVPPEFLGVIGCPSWWTPGALDELAHDAFIYVFVERLPKLIFLLEVLEDIDGLAGTYLDQFVYDRQKKKDPLGSHVYGLLRQVIDQMIDAEQLFVLTGDPRLRNETLLAISPEISPEAETTDLRLELSSWSDELLPSLLAKRRAEIVGILTDLLTGLTERVPAFRFGNLIGPLKSSLRQSLDQLWQQDSGEALVLQREGEECQLVRLVRQRADFIERDFFEKLVIAVDQALQRRIDQARGRRARKECRYLYRLWRYLKLHAAEASDDRLPSAHWLERHLSIPRKRIPELLELLGQVLTDWLKDGSTF